MSKSVWNGEKIIKQIETELFNKMRVATLFVKGEAQRRAPVDTGNLKKSINTEVKYDDYGGIVGTIGTNVEYAGAQEFGTTNQSGQPYLRPAILDNKEKIKKILSK